MIESASQSDSQLALRQELDRVLRQESEGVLEIVVFRGRETELWRQELAKGEELWARRLAVAAAHFPDFQAGIDERRCIACDKAFSCDSLPIDLVLAHARVSPTILPSAAVLGGVCRDCSEKHDAAELRTLFGAQLRKWYPDLREVEPASLSGSAGQA
jgi:hypothetical protein